MRCDHFVDIAVGVEANRVVGEGERVRVASAGRNAQITQQNAAAGVGINGHWNGCCRTAGPQGNALVEFDIQAIGFVEHR